MALGPSELCGFSETTTQNWTVSFCFPRFALQHWKEQSQDDTGNTKVCNETPGTVSLRSVKLSTKNQLLESEDRAKIAG